MNAAINYWMSLSRRDQTALLICGVALGVAIIWWALIAPSNKAVVEQANRTKATAETLATVREMALELAEYRSGGAGVSRSGDTPLSELIDRSLRARAMVLGSFQPVREGEVRLRLDDVPYNNLIAWLAEMETEHQLTTRELTITPTRVSGRVSASMRLAK